MVSVMGEFSKHSAVEADQLLPTYSGLNWFRFIRKINSYVCKFLLRSCRLPVTSKPARVVDMVTLSTGYIKFLYVDELSKLLKIGNYNLFHLIPWHVYLTGEIINRLLITK